MADILLDHARLWLERDGKVAIATVIETWGSAPVRVGGVMVVSVTGDFEGSVSGGCVESDVLANAEDTLRDGRLRTLAFGVEDATAWAVGLPCGGKIRIMIECIDGIEGRAYLEQLRLAARQRQAVAVTVDLEHGTRQVAALDSAAHQSGLLTIDGREVFRHVRAPALRTVIVGATHIGQALADLALKMGYDVVVVDPRQAFAADARFPGVAIESAWPEAAMSALGLDAFTAVAVVAHVEHIDDEALIAALSANCAYVGALGSKRSHARRLERLTKAGLGAEQLARIKAPIGLSIGAATPPEIALSIMAQIVAAFRLPASST